MVEAPLYKIENIQYDSRIPFSGGRRFKSSLPDQCLLKILRPSQVSLLCCVV
jgi:hypothetical protein